MLFCFLTTRVTNGRSINVCFSRSVHTRDIFRSCRDLRSYCIFPRVTVDLLSILFPHISAARIYAHGYLVRLSNRASCSWPNRCINKWRLLWERSRERRQNDGVCHNSVEARSVKVDLWYFPSITSRDILTRPLKTTSGAKTLWCRVFFTRPAHDASSFVMRALLRTFKQIVGFFGALARRLIEQLAHSGPPKSRDLCQFATVINGVIRN